MHLGDVITAASVIPVLKEQYPHSEIHYLVKDSVALPASLICVSIVLFLIPIKAAEGPWM